MVTTSPVVDFVSSDTPFEPGLVDGVISDILGTVEEWKENNEPYLPEMVKARDLTRQYILLWWKECGDDFELSCGEVADQTLSYFAGVMAVLPGQVRTS